MERVAGQSTSSVLRLDPVITIREISRLRDATLALLRQGTPAVVDCSAVERADVSLIQLLVSARRMARRDACRLDLVIPASGVVADLIRHSGLEHDFDTTGAVDD